MEEGTFESFNLRDVRLLSFDECEVRALLRDGSEVSIKFRNREELEAALHSWTHRNRGRGENTTSSAPTILNA
jgi:hypothetical protein